METTNKVNAINKINKYGKIGKIITIIMMVFLGFSLVATLASAILMKNIPDDVMRVSIGTQAEMVLNPSAVDPDVDSNELNKILSVINDGKTNSGLNLGALSLKFNKAVIDGDKLICTASGVQSDISLNKIGNMLLIFVVAFVLSIISIVFAYMLCKAIEKCESPFEENVLKKMRNFAYSLLPWALFSSLPEEASNSLFNNNIEMNFSLDFNIIFAVLIILALTAVFKYGAMLQQESDETL